MTQGDGWVGGFFQNSVILLGEFRLLEGFWNLEFSWREVFFMKAIGVFGLEWSKSETRLKVVLGLQVNGRFWLEIQLEVTTS